jgi:penicillin-binding protein 1A
MTVRLAQAIGIDEVIKTIEKFGIAQNLPPQYAIALGAWETSLLKLSSAYAAIANGGKKISPYMIDRIQDRRGNTIFQEDKRPCPQCENVQWSGQSPPQLTDTREQIVDPRDAYILTSMMEGVVQRGTARRVSVLGRPIAGKTGTTNDSFDAWFIGFTPDLVAGSYVGFDAPRTLGPKETGASVAAPIFIDFMMEALKGQPAIPFRVPPGVKFMAIDEHTGAPAIEGDPGTMMEAFKSDTDWNGNTGVIEGQTVAPSDIEFMNAVQPEGASSRIDGVY